MGRIGGRIHHNVGADDLSWRFSRLSMTRSLFLAHSCVLMLLAACHQPAGGAGEALRPDATSANDALGTAGIAACTSAAAGQPLVVDLMSSERSDLEVAMRDGIVAVRFDCKSLEILPGCAAPGEYRFAGVTRKEDLLRMNSKDEIAANLPLGSARFSAGMTRGSTFDLALVTVGKRRSAASEISRTDLAGTGCEAATHVVRGVYVGAFAMATGTEGEVQAVAQIFAAGVSAGSSADRQAQTKDGDLAACRTSAPDASAPPADCASITRLEVVPLVAAKRGEPPPALALGGATDAETVCAAGFVWDGLKCVSEANDRIVKPCDLTTGTKEQCRAACEAGSADSCYSYAVLKKPIEVGMEGMKRKTRFDYDETDVPLLERACAAGNAAACQASARYHDEFAGGQSGSPEAKKAASEKAAARREQSCSFGDAVSCATIAEYSDPNKEAPPIYVKSTDKLVAYTRRACDLGWSRACGQLGDMHRDGMGVKQDGAAALAAYERQCSAGGLAGGVGCESAGALLAGGKIVARDPRQALRYFRRACDLYLVRACTKGVELALESQEVATARALLENSCTAAVVSQDTCLALGEAYEQGSVGLQKDFALAAQAFQRSCVSGMCTRAGDLYARGGPNLVASPEKAFAAYARGCDYNDPRACGEVEARLKREDRAALTNFYQTRCEQKAAPDACVKWKTTGGQPGPEALARAAEAARQACQAAASGTDCRLWQQLGGKPTAKELARRGSAAK